MVWGKKMTGAVDPRKLHDNQPQTSLSRMNYQRVPTAEGQTHTQFKK